MRNASFAIVSLLSLSLMTIPRAKIISTNIIKHPVNTDSMKLKVTIGSTVFSATIQSNPTTTAFKAMLPLSIPMNELNGNEKFHYFTNSLPTNASTVGNIQIGDLMLYGNNCLVIFYEALHTSYKYTAIGRINDPTGLAKALGEGTVTVRFELQ